MEAYKIQRINELAKKAKTPQGLTSAEAQEQQTLRTEYVAAYRASLRAQLDNTVVVEPDGTRRRLKNRRES